ncbi:uncharacterized protein LJ206_020388 [Theristicus caerulescens]
MDALVGPRRQALSEGGSGLLDLPLGVKIPVLPGSKPVFCRTKLGEKLHQPSGYFNLGDPCCRQLSTEYNSLHDPHLRAYHKRKDNLRRLKREGSVTSDGKVVCTLKEFNEYRQYLTTLKLEAEKMLMREEKKLRQDLARLEAACELPGGTDVSRLREWLLQEQRKSLPGGERQRRQRHLTVIEKRIERLEALEQEQGLLRQAECQQQQQQPLGKRRQPGTRSSSEKCAVKGQPVGPRRQALSEGGSGLLDLPLGVKIPVLPGSKPVFCRTKLGEKLHQPSGYFNLGDPCCRQLSTEYNSLHDPHLRAYHKRKDNLRRLKREGSVTSDGKVVCTLKEFNEYRQYLTTLKLEAEKMLMREEKKLRQDLARLEAACELPGGTDVSRLREWLLQEQRKSLPGGERQRRQRHLTVIEKRIERLEALEQEQGLLRQAECQQQQQQPLGKRRQPGTRSSSEKCAVKGQPVGPRRQALSEGGSGLLDLPLGVKIPVLPGSKPVFCRTKLGEKLHQPSGYFNLGDPCCRQLSTEYNSLHDPHLRAYHKRKDNLRRLKREGSVTSDGKVVCTLKEFNEYRQYLTTLKLEAEKMLMREEKKLRQDLARLEAACELPGGTDVSRLREWLLQEQRKSLPGGERQRRQRHLTVIEKRIERLEALEQEQGLLRQAECQQQQQQPLGKRRQPGTRSSSEKCAVKGQPVGPRRQALSEGGSGLLDLPLGVKIPVLPGSKPVFCRTKLGEKLHQPSGYFNLGDPCCRQLSTEYNSLHDPHLRAYHKRKDNLRRLKREGSVTSDGKVVCTLKEFNEYRQYLTTLKLEAEKMLMREEKKLRQDLARLEAACELPGGTDVSRLREWLLQEQRKSLPGGERQRRQRHLTVIEKRIERLEALEQEQGLLRQAECQQQQQQPLGKRRQPGTRSSSEKCAVKGQPVGPRRQALSEGGSGLLDLPLGVKIPVLPGSKPVFCRTKLGEKLHQPSGYFNLGDPCCRQLSTEYNSLHDPHLRAYHKRKDNLRRLKREGSVTSDGKVVCTLKEFNEYRQYLTTLKLEAEKMLMREEKKLRQDLARLEAACELPGGTDVSRLREWLLQEQRKSLPGGERQRRQRHLTVIEKRIERLEALEQEQGLLRQAECQQQQQQPLGKRRQPGTRSSSEKCAVKGQPCPKRAGEEAPKSIQATVLRAALAEDEELKEGVESVVQAVLERVKALDQSIDVLRRAPPEVSGRLFASAREAEPLAACPADRREEIGLVAGEIVATALERFGEGLVPRTSAAAEAGPAARRGEAEVAASERASSRSSLAKMTKEAVESVSSTLSSFVASQFEQEFGCQFSEVLKLQGVTEGQGSRRASERQMPEASKRAKLPVLQALQNAAAVSQASRELAEESIQKAICRVQELDAELVGYARTIVLEVVETLRRKLEEERKCKQNSEPLQARKVLPPLSLPAIVRPSEEAGESKEESSQTLLPPLLRDPERDARRAPEDLQKCQDDTCGATARSSVPACATLRILRPGSTAGTLPSTGPQFPRQPVPPAGPKPPAQAGAWRRPVRLKLFLEEPMQPESLKRAVAGNLVEGVLRRCAAPGPQGARAAPPGRE